MKNIYEILSLFGLEVSQEAKQDFEKELFGSYKSVAELERKDAKILALQKELEEANNQEGLNAEIEKLRQALTEKDAQHAKALASLEFTALLEKTISSAGGKNPKAITALLDVEALQASENQKADLQTAIEKLQKSDGYLFGGRETPPPYARGTGSFTGAERKAPTTLAGALRERFEKERK